MRKAVHTAVAAKGGSKSVLRNQDRQKPEIAALTLANSSPRRLVEMMGLAGQLWADDLELAGKHFKILIRKDNGGGRVKSYGNLS